MPPSLGRLVTDEPPIAKSRHAGPAMPALQVRVDPQRVVTYPAAEPQTVGKPIGREPVRAPHVVVVQTRGLVHAGGRLVVTFDVFDFGHFAKAPDEARGVALEVRPVAPHRRCRIHRDVPAENTPAACPDAHQRRPVRRGDPSAEGDEGSSVAAVAGVHSRPLASALGW